jgi:hypothetical protein
MGASKATRVICAVGFLLWPGASEADILQLKCSGTNTDIRYSKVEMDGKIYFADKFGKISVPNVAELTGKRIVVYSSGNQGTGLQVPPDGQIYAPCQ